MFTYYEPKIYTSINEPSPGLTANHRGRSSTPLPSPSPHQNPRLLPRLASCKTKYLALCVGPITHCPFYLHLHFGRANLNNKKRAAAKQRVTRNASALFTSALRCKVFLLCALSLCRTPATATTTAAMDLFKFYPPSSVLICKPCGYAVPPTALSTHIKVHHLHDARHAATNLFNAP
jgi:hypothetical protein